ncbi:MAG: arginine--tRNA ligase [Bacteroidetes bacterium]|nr:arginine--tRNA ligase [Bacteroidota bacterium]
MAIAALLRQAVTESLGKLYGGTFTEDHFQVNQTKPEFEGDYTIVLFALVKQLKKSPDGLGNELGAHLVAQYPHLFSAYNIIKGFLNLVVADAYWLDLLQRNHADAAYGRAASKGERVMVEYSSPNTNKPLHLGHLRNNFLGWSTAEILKAGGYDVVKTCIVNDRGVHICKSMIAWQRFANGATPASTGEKGDHFVGDYYVKFNDELKRQSAPIAAALFAGDAGVLVDKTAAALAQKHLDKIQQLEAAKAGKDAKQTAAIDEKIATEKEGIKDIAENATEIMRATKQMLVDWENGKPDVIALWKTMNSWVYEGFDATYRRIGSDFDKIYYESNTYLLGKDLVEEGLKKGVFFKKEDGSVWIDLTADGLDEKLVRRGDGTSVYITQDIGLAEQKQKEFNTSQSIYVVGDEQNYHFKVLKLICQKLGLPSANGIYHLSYGMVELPTGKMKSREGTVVDADDIVQEMVVISEQKTAELGKVKDFNEQELAELYETIGLGALKFFLLRVDPKKKMIFNPEESIDFHGFTGPFIQYTHARIKSILRKETAAAGYTIPANAGLLPLEKELLILLEQYGAIIGQAAAEHDPSVVANYAYSVAKTFNSFVTEHRVLTAETEEKKQLRLQLCQMTGHVIASAFGLLGIRVPERM